MGILGSTLDISKPGKTTMVIHYGPPDKDHPKGGNLNRMEAMLLHPRETWDDVVTRLLDNWDDTKKPVQ